MYNAGNFNHVSGKTIATPTLKQSLMYDKSFAPNPKPTAPIENAKTKAMIKKLTDRKVKNRNWDAKVAILPFGATDIATQGNVKFANTPKHSILKTR